MLDIDFVKTKLAENKKRIPVKEAHAEIAPHRANELAVLKQEQIKYASVMLLLFPYKGELSTVFIHRNTYKGVHSDQISFPGGSREKEDANDFETALRETEEELGVPRDSIQKIAQLGTIYIPVSNFQVTPFVGYAKEVPLIEKDPREVADYFFSPLSHFLEKEAIQFMDIVAVQGITIHVPCFVEKGNIIWGATAMIMNEFRYLITQ